MPVQSGVLSPPHLFAPPIPIYILVVSPIYQCKKKTIYILLFWRGLRFTPVMRPVSAGRPGSAVGRRSASRGFVMVPELRPRSIVDPRRWAGALPGWLWAARTAEPAGTPTPGNTHRHPDRHPHARTGSASTCGTWAPLILKDLEVFSRCMRNGMHFHILP